MLDAGRSDYTDAAAYAGEFKTLPADLDQAVRS